MAGGNNELQSWHRFRCNAAISNGNLVITARKTNSGKIIHLPGLVAPAKGDWKYGCFRNKGKTVWCWLACHLATIPITTSCGPGLVPGNWYNGACRVRQDNVHCTIHTASMNANNSLLDRLQTNFHIYHVDWTPYAIRGICRDTKYFEYTSITELVSLRMAFDQIFMLIWTARWR